MLRHMAEVLARPCKRCQTMFTPSREMFGRNKATFCSLKCRLDYWRDAYHWTPHPCPLCTVVHDPEEAPMLDALEHWIGDNASPGTGGNYDQLWAADLKVWIAGRRATMRGESGAEGSRL